MKGQVMAGRIVFGGKVRCAPDRLRAQVAANLPARLGTRREVSRRGPVEAAAGEPAPLRRPKSAAADLEDGVPMLAQARVDRAPA